MNIPHRKIIGNLNELRINIVFVGSRIKNAMKTPNAENINADNTKTVTSSGEKMCTLRMKGMTTMMRVARETIPKMKLLSTFPSAIPR